TERFGAGENVGDALQELVAGEAVVTGANDDQIRLGRHPDVAVGRQVVPGRGTIASGDPGHVRAVADAVGDRAAPGIDLGGDALVAVVQEVAADGAGRPPVRSALVPRVQHTRAAARVAEILVREIEPRVHDPDHDAAAG